LRFFAPLNRTSLRITASTDEPNFSDDLKVFSTDLKSNDERRCDMAGNFRARLKLSFDSLAVFTALALAALVKLGALKRIPW
jgi:hypothetical protein